MFLALYHSLRAMGVPVSLMEWLTLLEALSKGLHNQNLGDFYYVARSLLVKDVAHYDSFDQAFAHCFKAAPLPDDDNLRDSIFTWFQEPLSLLRLPGDEVARLKALTLNELLRELEMRLREQERGRQGEQGWGEARGAGRFGVKGSHPSVLSLESGGGAGRAAMPAFDRHYRKLRNDLTLDVRQIGMALKRLRKFRKSGVEEILDLEATIDQTCKNAGEIDLVFARERENQVRLLLVMDTGGSMEPYRSLSERLFSAAHGLNHFKDFRAFYFHNCIYENLYSNLDRYEFVPTTEAIREFGEDYRLIVVGDAAMAPYELMNPHGTIERSRTCTVRGIDWLQQLSEGFPRRAWLNPLSERSWVSMETVPMVGRLFPMFPLTLEGLTRAVRHLL